MTNIKLWVVLLMSTLSVSVAFAEPKCSDANSVAASCKVTNMDGEGSEAMVQVRARTEIGRSHLVALTEVSQVVQEREHNGPRISKEKADKAMTFGLEAVLHHTRDHFLIFGSALGVYRDGGFITGDDDVDIAAPLETFDEVKESLLAAGHKVRTYTNKTHYGFKADKVASFWFFTTSSDGQWLCFGGACANARWRTAFPKSMMLPSQAKGVTKIAGLTYVRLPKSPEDFFTLHYGAGWKHRAHKKAPVQAGYNRYDAHCVNDDETEFARCDPVCPEDVSNDTIPGQTQNHDHDMVSTVHPVSMT